jgi:hypothetical protein
MLVWGRGGAAAYEPARDTWQRLPAGPLSARIEQSAVWTGRELIVWGGEACADACLRRDGAAFHP